MPPIFVTAASIEKIATLLTVLFTLLNDFLKTNTGNHIQTNIIPCDIKFYISLF